MYKKLQALALFALSVSICGHPANAAEAQPKYVTLAESKLYTAPDDAIHSFNDSINLQKGQDKLELYLTYYDGTSTAPQFRVLRIQSPTMNFLTEGQFGKRKELTFDVTNELTYGGLQLMIQAQGPKGAEFGWRVTTPQPKIGLINQKSAMACDSFTIDGTNFCPTPEFNVVTIAGQEAKCIDATSTRLVVKVPEDVKTGVAACELKVLGMSAGKFELGINSAPIVTALGNNTYFSTDTTVNGYYPPMTPIVVDGHNFSADKSKMKVTVGAYDCPITNATAESVTFTTPEDFLNSPFGIHQPIKVYVNGVRAKGNLFVNVLLEHGEYPGTAVNPNSKATYDAAPPKQ